jgi:hypothetical protein
MIEKILREALSPVFLQGLSHINSQKEEEIFKGVIHL